jgi:hypothetical protein
VKHRSLLITVPALLLVLLVAGTAQAFTPSHNFVSGAPHWSRAAAASSALGGARLAAPLNPFAAVGTGTASLNGVVYDGTMTPVNAAIVDWWAPTAGVWNTDRVTTGVDGAYSFTTADAAIGNGELWVYSPDATNGFIYERYGLSWTAPGPTTFDFQAGVVPIVAYRGGYFKNYWNSAWFEFDGSDAQGSLKALQFVHASNTTTTPVTANANVLAANYTTGCVNFRIDEGMEFTPPTVVDAGGTSSTVSVNEVDAARTMVVSPYWVSGKPGTTVQVWMNKFPAGWTVDFSGYSDWPASASVKSFGSKITSGATNLFRQLTVPTTATPGYAYWIGEMHNGGLLYMETTFQVATLKPSASTINHGATVTLTGVIPTRDHQGSTPGLRKTVVLYKRSTSAGQPHNYASPAGWTKVGSFLASGLGKYTFKQHPTRTTYYVVRYPGDKWYWGAFTSVIHVHVR